MITCKGKETKLNGYPGYSSGFPEQVSEDKSLNQQSEYRDKFEYRDTNEPVCKSRTNLKVG